MTLRAALLGLFFIAASAPAFAAHHVLFNSRGEPIPDYTSTVSSLRDGDSVGFSNGVIRHVIRRLGQNNTSVIFENEDGRASRINKKISPNRENFVDKTYYGYAALEATGAPAIKLYRETYIPGEHVEVALLPEDAEALDDWLTEYERCLARGSRCTESEIREHLQRRQDLVRFLEGFAHFTTVDDFNNGQVYWAGHRWLLIDWANKHSFATAVTGIIQTVTFLGHPRLISASDNGNDMLAEIRRAVEATRARLEDEGRFPYCPGLLRR